MSKKPKATKLSSEPKVYVESTEWVKNSELIPKFCKRLGIDPNIEFFKTRIEKMNKTYFPQGQTQILETLEEMQFEYAKSFNANKINVSEEKLNYCSHDINPIIVSSEKSSEKEIESVFKETEDSVPYLVSLSEQIADQILDTEPEISEEDAKESLSAKMDLKEIEQIVVPEEQVAKEIEIAEEMKMAYKNSVVAAIKCGGKVLREIDGKVFVSPGSEYSILIKNLSKKKAKFVVFVNDTNLFLEKKFTEVLAGKETEIFRYASGKKIILNEDKRIDTIKILYYFEKDKVQLKFDDFKVDYYLDDLELLLQENGVSYIRQIYLNRDEDKFYSSLDEMETEYQDEKFQMNLRVFAHEEPVFAQETKKKFCPNCGTKIGYTDKFCSNCGKKIPPHYMPTHGLTFTE